MTEPRRSASRSHAEILHDILDPLEGSSKDGEQHLKDLAMLLDFNRNGEHSQNKEIIPTMEEFAADLEDCYLTPKAKMGSHVLHSYQM
jgi:hypothetical protein